MNVRDMLTAMVAEGATDVMFSAGNPPCIRVQGAIRPFGAQALNAEAVARLVASFLTDDQKATYSVTHELDCSITVPGVGRFRVNLFQQRGTPAVVMRTIGERVPTIEELYLPGALDRFAALDEGLVCVAGPSGSGKSTTVAALVDRINTRRACHIVTMEQPVEYVHPMKKSLVEQREIGTDTLSYIEALKHVMRQAPDVVVVGEISDLETIAAVLKIAETGHLVITTLTTRSVAQTVDRLVEVFPAYQVQQVRSQLAWTLRGIVCQQLLPTAQGHGLRVACEVMVATPAIAGLITEGKTHLIPKAMADGAAVGMMSMDESIARLVETKAVRAEAAIPLISDPVLAREARDAVGGASTAGGAGGGSFAGPESLADDDEGGGGGSRGGEPALSARQLERQLYSAKPSVRRAAEKMLKKLQEKGDTDADEILRQFEQFYGTNYEELKRGVRPGGS